MTLGGVHSITITINRVVLLRDVGCTAAAAVKRGREEKAVGV